MYIHKEKCTNENDSDSINEKNSDEGEDKYQVGERQNLGTLLHTFQVLMLKN